MKFGDASPLQVRAMRTALQPDPDVNALVLRGVSSHAPNVYVGCPVWSEKTWRDILYAPSLATEQMLGRYAQQFNTVEVNSTHYAVPSDAVFDNWRNAVPDNFRFCPKFPKQISHDAALLGVSHITAHFLKQIHRLGPTLGRPFLQMGQEFGPAQGASLIDYVRDLPLPIAVEVRHPSWFEPRYLQRLCERLHPMGHSLIITDTAGRRDAVHMALSSPTAMIRFRGYDIDPTDSDRIKAWAQRVQEWLEQGLQTLYVFAHSEVVPTMPGLGRQWVQALNPLLSEPMHMPEVHVLTKQQGLF